MLPSAASFNHRVKHTARLNRATEEANGHADGVSKWNGCRASTRAQARILRGPGSLFVKRGVSSFIVFDKPLHRLTCPRA